MKQSFIRQRTAPAARDSRRAFCSLPGLERLVAGPGSVCPQPFAGVYGHSLPYDRLHAQPLTTPAGRYCRLVAMAPSSDSYPGPIPSVVGLDVPPGHRSTAPGAAPMAISTMDDSITIILDCEDRWRTAILVGYLLLRP